MMRADKMSNGQVSFPVPPVGGLPEGDGRFSLEVSEPAAARFSPSGLLIVEARDEAAAQQHLLALKSGHKHDTLCLLSKNLFFSRAQASRHYWSFRMEAASAEPASRLARPPLKPPVSGSSVPLIAGDDVRSRLC